MKKVKSKKRKALEILDEENIVEEVLEDFKMRSFHRKPFERAWQLNINFFLGNQFCSVDSKGDIIDNFKQYFWEEREVFNHITPLVELRLSKLSRVRPSLTVVPFSDEQNDVSNALLSKKILKAVSHKLNMPKILSQATMWSEICGTVFYKIGWNEANGRVVAVSDSGQRICEGDVEISVVSPFEIYPDSNTYNNIEECNSIIYARAFHVDTVKNIWGIEEEGSDINVFSLDNISNTGGLGYQSTTSTISQSIKKNHVLVIEKYEMPTIEYPNGRLIIVVGKTLAYMGELPYINACDGKRGFPFIKQCAIPVPHCFWGRSVIERCIPIQRAYNAVKNRKHEYLNRLTMGILTVEDGSIDMENLEEEGLSPGKVLVYRQGSTGPRLLSTGSVPLDFQYEENQLLSEFIKISGVSDLLGSNIAGQNLSGIALQLLIEQDEIRLISSAEEIRTAAKEIAKQILRLYKQFAVFPHSSKLISEDGSVEIFYWKNSNITSEDIVFETENEINETLAQKRSMIFELLRSGLLNDENGKLTNSARVKILEQLGFGIWESGQDIKNLQTNRATKENLMLINENNIPSPKEIDDHEVHINNHISFMLSKEFDKHALKDKALEEKLLAHIKEHKIFGKLTAKADMAMGGNSEN